jgi:hypothetical protein
MRDPFLQRLKQFALLYYRVMQFRDEKRRDFLRTLPSPAAILVQLSVELRAELRESCLHLF